MGFSTIFIRRPIATSLLMVALLIAGVARALYPDAPEGIAFGVLILAISRAGRVIIPWGKTVIQPEDHIVIVAASDSLAWVEKALADS